MINTDVETNKTRIEQSKSIAKQIAILLEQQNVTLDVADSAIRRAGEIIRSQTHIKLNPHQE